MTLIRFFRTVYADNRLRVRGRRRALRDLALYALNAALRPVEKLLIRRYASREYPVVFIVGAPRSGTTVLFQLLAYFLDVGYINNRTARFWMAPVLATAIDRRRRPGFPQFPFESSFGAAPGGDAPHEFSWFWQYWMRTKSYDHLSEAELAATNWKPVQRELEALSGMLRKPVVFKSINFVDYHVPWFAQLLPRSIFIWIRRDPSFVVQSILESRRKRYGSESVWWSVRPRDIGEWSARSPLEQVCHQVADIERELDRASRTLPPARFLTVRYEEIVENPRGVLDRVAIAIGAQWRDRQESPSSKSLANGNRVRRADFDRIAPLLERS